ncbi:MAG: class I SAM-dependent methyltransferase [Terracidiphilus sp.]
MSDKPNATASTTDFEFSAMSEARNYRAKLVEEFQTHLRGNVAEVGAGIGQITEELAKLPNVQRLLSIEPDELFCEKFRDRLPQAELLHGTIEDLQGDSSWNAIVSINVLEHIEQDEKELAAYYRALRATKGTLCLFVPARPELYAPIERDFGHFRRYTKAELCEKLERNGFHSVNIRYYNVLGYFAWWVSFCLLKRRSFDVASVRLFDRVLFPVVHLFETRVCSPPIGQSLLVIAKAG